MTFGNDPSSEFVSRRGFPERHRGPPGAVDVFVRQRLDYPTVDVNVDRILWADEAGLTQRDVCSSLLGFRSGSGQVALNQRLDPQNE